MIKERKQNSTSYPIVFFMADSTDHNTGKTLLSPTVQLSKNGAGFGAALGTVSEIGLGFYSIAGNATDRNTLGPLIMVATATGADTAQAVMNIVSYDPYDANLGLTNLDAAVSTRSSHNAAAIWAVETRALTDKAGFALDSAYDAAKSAASQSSVDAVPTAVENRQEMDTNSTKLARLDVAVSTRSTLGAGGTAKTYVVTDGTNPVANVEVWVTTDAAGSNIIAYGITNISGQIVFMLDSGTYYMWRHHPNYTFTNPDTEVVS